MQRSVECESQGVRRVIGFWYFLQVQEMEEHALHFLFRRAPIARDGEFQLERGGLENGASLLCRCRDDDSPRMCHIHGAPFVPREEELFDDDKVWVRFFEECCEISGNLLEALGEWYRFCSDREPIRCLDV